MIEFGENLKFERFEIHDINTNAIALQNASGNIKTIQYEDICSFEITGSKSSSGFCGTMEHGMSNPTVLLPTNFFFNVINLFKRKKDTVYYKVTLSNRDPIIIYTDSFAFKEALNNRLHTAR